VKFDFRAILGPSAVVVGCLVSLDQACLPALDVNAYHPERAQRLALRYATGEPETGLSELHRADPCAYPSPVVVRRWRSVWPAFDALMREAEAARGLALMEATLGIADNPRTQAARAKNAIAVRWRMAEALDPATFGQRRIMAGDPNAPLRVGAAVELTDAELAAIARGVDPALLLGGPAPPDASLPAPPAPPATRAEGLRRGDEGGHVSTADSILETSTPGSLVAGSDLAQKFADIQARVGSEKSRAGASAEGAGSGREARLTGVPRGLYARLPDSSLALLAQGVSRDPVDDVYGVGVEAQTQGEGYELD
jgi:hypothetical protein